MKRLISLILTITSVLTCMSFAVIGSTAASAIKLSVPFFCQRSEDVCVNACLSMTEAYYHGHGQNNDYVYNKVMSFNPGAALGSGNCSKLGYKSVTCTLQSVYNELAKGNPVIIQRSGHFAVVYAYQPTSTTLEAKDFKVLNPYRSSNKPPYKVVGPGTIGYSDMAAWLKNNTWKTAWVKTADKIGIVDADSTKYAFNYNANGGSGSGSSVSVFYGQNITIANNAFTRTGYTLTGYHVKRSDGRWYVPSHGWFTDSEITANGYTKKLYKAGESYAISNAWTGGATTAFTYTFYAQWTEGTFALRTFENYSDKNYMIDSAFLGAFNASFWASRNTSISTVSVDTEVKHDSRYNTLKIVNTAAGASSGSKDLLFATSTNSSAKNDGAIGDNKSMILSFWAKSSKAGTKMYFRWGYETSYRSITLSDSWQFYTVKMDKTTACGSNMHPYIDSVGTVWLSEMQLEDGTTATAFQNETGAYKVVNGTYTSTYSNLHTPARAGYTFDGWYTAKTGGTRITGDTAVLPYGMAVYAHWSEADDHVHSYLVEVTKEPTYIDTGVATYTCSCGHSYTEAIPVKEYKNPFTDVKEKDWFYSAVEYVAKRSYMNGMSLTAFSPNGALTREQFVMILANMAGVDTDMYKNEQSAFSDVESGKWYTGAIIWATEKGYVNGIGGGRFGTGMSIDRASLVKLLYFYAADTGLDTKGKGDLTPFADYSKVEDWMTEGMQWAVYNGIIGGMMINGEMCLEPKGTATRAQAAKILTVYDGLN